MKQDKKPLIFGISIIIFILVFSIIIIESDNNISIKESDKITKFNTHWSEYPGNETNLINRCKELGANKTTRAFINLSNKFYKDNKIICIEVKGG